MGCTTLSSVRSDNRENLNKIKLGMSKDEVLKIMGTDTKTCYDPTICGLATFPLYTLFLLPICLINTEKITNPYKIETLQSQDETRNFEILYYYAEKKKEGRILRGEYSITDDELTPLVFENNKLIGWGWMFLDDKVRKYELRIR